jgi:hypothetical protein
MLIGPSRENQFNGNVNKGWIGDWENIEDNIPDRDSRGDVDFGAEYRAAF